MARLIPYRQQTSPGGTFGPGPDARAAPVVDLGRAVGQFGEALTQVAEQNAALDATLQYTQDTEHWTKELVRRKEAMEPGAENFAGTVSEDYKKWAEERISKAQTPRAKRWMQERYSALGASLFGDAVNIEASERVRYSVERAKKSSKAAQVVADIDPSKYAEQRAAVMTGISQIAGDNPTLRNELGQTEGEELGVQGSISLIRRDPAGVLASLDAAKGKGKYQQVNDVHDEDNRNRLRSMAQAELNRRENEAGQAKAQASYDLTARIADTQAMARNGKVDPAPPTKADVYAVHGDNPDKAARIWKDLQGEISLGMQLSTVAMTPTSQLLDTLDKAAPKEGEGYAYRKEQFDAYRDGVANIVKARNDDPAGFMLSTDKTTQANYAAIARADAALQAEKDPSRAVPLRAARQAAAEHYAQEMVAAQKHLEMPVRVLSDQQAQNIAGQFVQSFDEQGGGGQPAALGIVDEREKWGAYWPSVYSQLAKDLPPVARVIGEAIPTRDPKRQSTMNLTAAGILAQMSTVKPDDLGKRPLKKNMNEIKTSITEEMQDYRLSIMGQADGEALYDSHFEAALLLAVAYGGSADGITKAVGDVVGFGFQFRKVGESVVRVPMGYSPDMVEAVLPALGYKEFWDAGYTDVENARWVTSRDNRGVVLTHNGSEVPRKDGKSSVTYTWQQLVNLAATRAEDARNATPLAYRGFK